MKHLIYIVWLFSIAACKQELPRQEALLANDPNVDSLVATVNAAKQSNNTDDELITEFAIVNDANGYSYVRSSPEKSGAVVDTLKNETIVFCMEPVGDWMGIDYRNDPEMKDFKHGLIHKSRLLMVGQYAEVSGLVQTDNGVVLGDERINITLTQKAFDPSQHKLNYNKLHNYLETINGKHFWGTDGDMPKREYKNISINLNGIETEIPVTGLAQLYEPNLNYTSANYDNENDVLYIQSFNSDGAGGYCILWRIENGRYKDRWVYYGF